MMSARQENSRTLASAIGVTDDHAVALLDASVLLTVAAGEERLATRIRELLQRTLPNVVTDVDASKRPAVEILVGRTAARSSAPVIGVNVSGYKFAVRDGQVASSGQEPAAHTIVELLAACYAAAAAVHRATEAELPMPIRLPIEVDLAALLGTDVECLHQPVDLGTVFMAGAGAIGNGVLLGFSAFDVHGDLHVCDPDTVTPGNLNRCVWFTADDLGAYKAERLVVHAQPHVPRLRLVAHGCVLKDVPVAKQGGAWLDKLIIAVDSRRVRRALQNEMPHHVFDASTTGIAEVVLHFNSLPSSHACLSCVYYEAPDETAHEAHVAESLGVAVADVRSNFVTVEAARAIASRYPELVPETLVGLAYDSLFKQLCGQGALKTEADRQVLAPFAFVSVLAGVLLAVELVRRVHRGSTELPFNYWRVSPWSAPVARMRELRPKRTTCEFCDNPVLQGIVRELWDGHGE